MAYMGTCTHTECMYRQGGTHVYINKYKLVKTREIEKRGEANRGEKKEKRQQGEKKEG